MDHWFGVNVPVYYKSIHLVLYSTVLYCILLFSEVLAMDYKICYKSTEYERCVQVIRNTQTQKLSTSLNRGPNTVYKSTFYIPFLYRMFSYSYVTQVVIFKLDKI
jgi:hypothetical protein